MTTKVQAIIFQRTQETWHNASRLTIYKDLRILDMLHRFTDLLIDFFHLLFVEILPVGLLIVSPVVKTGRCRLRRFGEDNRQMPPHAIRLHAYLFK